MRKLAIFICFFVAVSAEAQTSKEDWMVGGNFALNTSSNTTVTLTPGVGYFVINNLVVGGALQFQYSKISNNKETSFGVGPYARYYFLKNNLKPFLMTEYLFTSNRREVGAISSTVNGGDFFLGGGLAAFVNEHVAIETIAGYINSKKSGTDSDGGLAIRIGFQIYLSPRSIVDTYRK
jgi:Outer membrane protein beta-barrel domain